MRLLMILVSVLAVFGCRERLSGSSTSEEQARVADSLRVADSVRIADSLMFAALGEAEKGYHTQRAKQQRQEEQDALAASEAQREWASLEESDVTGPVEIRVPAGHPLAPRIDSLSALVEAGMNKACANDAVLGKLRDQAGADRRGYLEFVLKHAKRDTATVARAAHELWKVEKLEVEKLELLVQTQEGDRRSVVFRHLRAKRDEILKLRAFAFALSDSTR